MSYNFDKDQNHYFFKNNNSIPLVFIHGVGLNQGMWQPQISYFKDETILTYDLLGHGKTKCNKNTIKIEDFRSQLKNLLVNLNIQKINLVGFSIGSLIAFFMVLFLPLRFFSELIGGGISLLSKGAAHNAK